jgi:hypothetical protein
MLDRWLAPTNRRLVPQMRFHLAQAPRCRAGYTTWACADPRARPTTSGFCFTRVGRSAATGEVHGRGGDAPSGGDGSGSAGGAADAGGPGCAASAREAVEPGPRPTRASGPPRSRTSWHGRSACSSSAASADRAADPIRPRLTHASALRCWRADARPLLLALSRLRCPDRFRYLVRLARQPVRTICGSPKTRDVWCLRLLLERRQRRQGARRGESQVHVARVTHDNLMLDTSFRLDFNSAFPAGPARPHGLAFK